MGDETGGGSWRKDGHSAEFKLAAVKLATERGVAGALAVKDLHIFENVPLKCVRELRKDLQKAFF